MPQGDGDVLNRDGGGARLDEGLGRSWEKEGSPLLINQEGGPRPIIVEPSGPCLELDAVEPLNLLGGFTAFNQSYLSQAGGAQIRIPQDVAI